MRALFVMLSTFLLAPFFAYAQISLPNIENSVLVTMTPNYPAPGDTVHLQLQSPILDLTGSSVVWYQDGQTLPNATDNQSLDITAGALGTQTTVEADVQTLSGERASATITIVPSQLDIMYDSDAYVPPFYRGRALPSPGSTIHLQAVAHFRRATGEIIPDDQIYYTWKQDDATLANQSGRGENTISVTSSPLSTAETITVRAQTFDGSFVNEQTVQIPLQKPSLVLYIDDPLFGILFNNALAQQSVAPDSDITIAAIPFFANASSAEDPSLQYAWTVNDQDIVSTSSVHSEIELGASGNNSLARVNLTLTSDANIFMNISNAWNLLFSPTGSRAQQSTPNNNRFLQTN